MNKKRWFAVKTLHRWSIKKSSAGDRIGRIPSFDLFEERVILLRTTTARQAIARAERDAREYSKTKAVNPWGQAIRGRYLGECDCFELFDKPADETMVYSSSELISRNRKDKQIADAKLGKSWANEAQLRYRFADGEFVKRMS